jgi:hypothetical protein
MTTPDDWWDFFQSTPSAERHLDQNQAAGHLK